MSHREALTDAAIALAKQHSHPEVQVEHVTVAVLTRYREPKGPVPASDVAAAMERLPSPGEATSSPEMSEAAAKVLAECTSQASALAAIGWSTDGSKLAEESSTI